MVRGVCFGFHPVSREQYQIKTWIIFKQTNMQIFVHLTNLGIVASTVPNNPIHTPYVINPFKWDTLYT